MLDTQRADGTDLDTACARLAEDQSAFVARLIGGDQRAADCLDAAYRPRLSRLVRSYLRNDDDVAEAVQDTFVQALKALPRFRGAAGLATWLHRIAINQALTTLRRRRRHPEEPLSDVLENEVGMVWAGASSEDRAIDAQTRDRVRSAIATLPPRYRETVDLVHVEELSLDESAVRLRVTKNAAKIRVMRARRALKGVLGPHHRTL
jgi:RNA polymerase sigma-70 factor, ECF subfamily